MDEQWCKVVATVLTKINTLINYQLLNDDVA